MCPLQPVADKPFTFETELDDLPKEKLKGKSFSAALSPMAASYPGVIELIYKEMIQFVPPSSSTV